MTSEFLLKNATLADGTNADICVRDGRIHAVGAGLSCAGEIIDCSGLIALPGLVDLHTHLRQPGGEQSETIATGSAAAAAGGFTAIHAMANTDPVADNAAVVDQVFNLAQEIGLVEVRPIGAVTVGLEGKSLANFEAMNESAASVLVFSDDGKCVSDASLMREALARAKAIGAVIAQHAQEPSLTEGAQMNAGELASKLGLQGWPNIAEEIIIARDILMADELGAKLHICHLSTKGSVEIVRAAKARGSKVTAEATPHHLLLTEEKASTGDSVFKVNPPLRTNADVLALRDAVADGTIDIIATDHAPHSADKKASDWRTAAFGMTGLETALSIAQKVIVDEMGLSWQKVAELLSENPARIGQLLNQGQAIKAGTEANLVLVDPHVTRRIAGASESKSSNTPFEGMDLPGQVIHTIYRGQFSLRDSTVQKQSEGK
jgi:dihydroorotase